MTEHDRTSPARRFRRATFAFLAVILVAILALAWITLSQSQRATKATTNAVSLAEQIRQSCEQGRDVTLGDQDLCKQASDVAAQPDEIQPAKGDKGDPGPTGATGATGASGSPGKQGEKGDTGEAGEAGRDGEDSTVAGPSGAAGASGAPGKDGKDSLVPGSKGEKGDKGDKGDPGADSTVPGPSGAPGKDGTDGAPGKDGKDGRGITGVKCVGTGDTSHWEITYTDGTTQTSDGPCRITVSTPTADPTTATPTK